LELHRQWLTQKTLTQNYNFSLRLVNPDGIELAQFDGQPGYGYLPSSGWPAGEWVNDWLALPLPDRSSLSDDEPLALVARLYDVETGETVLTRRLGEIEAETLLFRLTEPVYILPENIEPLAVDFENLVGLRGYTMDQKDGLFELTLYWEALQDGQEDLFHFVHLVDPQTGEIIAQHDSMPQGNSYPTSQWSAGEIIADSMTLNISEPAMEDYLVFVGLYRHVGGTFPRLTAVDDRGLPILDDRFMLPMK